jgi:hypothetical protein
MNTLTLLRDEMRALGIKSLTVELEPRGIVDDRPTDAPAPLEPAPLDDHDVKPEKGPGTCVAPGCSNRNGGVFGAAVELCELHALAEAGVR